MDENTGFPRSRRYVLTSLAVPLAVGVTGCTDESFEDAEQVVVENWHADDHTVDVAFVDAV